MKYSEFRRWLKKQGCTFDESRGKGSHGTVYYGKRRAPIGNHGSKEIPEGTRKAILKQLGLKDN